MTNSSGDNLRKEWNLPPQPDFQEGPAPRPVNMEEIRALHRGELSEEQAEELETLIINFREWHDADREILIEMAMEGKEKLDDEVLTGPFAEAFERILATLKDGGPDVDGKLLLDYREKKLTADEMRKVELLTKTYNDWFWANLHLGALIRESGELKTDE